MINKKEDRFKLIFIFIIISLLEINISIAYEEKITPPGIHYDSAILEQFKNQSEVRILVRLNDNSGLPVTSVNQIDAWFRPQVDAILNDLSNPEFQLANKFTDGFSGYISQEGFNRLINDSRVKSIIFSPENSGASAMDNKNKNNYLLWILLPVGILLFFIILYLIKHKKR